MALYFRKITNMLTNGVLVKLEDPKDDAVAFVACDPAAEALQDGRPYPCVPKRQAAQKSEAKRSRPLMPDCATRRHDSPDKGVIAWKGAGRSEYAKHRSAVGHFQAEPEGTQAGP